MVRRADRVPVDRGQLHARVGALVEGAREGAAVPVHGQRQRALPLGHLPLVSARHRRRLHAHQPAALAEYFLSSLLVSSSLEIASRYSLAITIALPRIRICYWNAPTTVHNCYSVLAKLFRIKI